MTDAHCHVSCGDSSVRELLVGRDFFGVHPWETLEECKAEKRKVEEELRSKLIANPKAGVGEIGLDRLKVRDIPPLMREVFESQLALALELRRPVVLHGAKCWGQVVTTVCRHLSHSPTPPLPHSPTPSVLFHGFSRSDGLIPEIVELNGFISVGPAVLNDHAVNYRELVKKIPLDRLLVETDRTEKTIMNDELRIMNNGRKSSSIHNSSFIIQHSIYDVLNKTAEVIGISAAELEKTTDENADRFLGAV